MMTTKSFIALAAAFPEATQAPHFDKTAFKISKKIFVTIDEKTKRACVKLSSNDQDIFSLIDKNMIYPVPNKWGLQGWTIVELTKAKKEVCVDILQHAYLQTAPKKFHHLIKISNGELKLIAKKCCL